MTLVLNLGQPQCKCAVAAIRQIAVVGLPSSDAVGFGSVV